MTGTGSGAESRVQAMAKLFNNAGDKPILPSSLKPPIAMAMPAGSGGLQRANLVVRPASSAAYDQAQRKPASAWRRQFRRADKPLTPWRGAAFYLAAPGKRLPESLQDE